MGCPEAELSLTLVGDRAMSRLNRATFGKSGPTNVISFPVDWADEPGGGNQGKRVPALSPTPPPTTPKEGEANAKPRPTAADTPPLVLGEVVISVETTRREAAESDWPWEELLDFYLIHGILHLMGYDHETPEDAARMEDKSWELLEVLQEKA